MLLVLRDSTEIAQKPFDFISIFWMTAIMYIQVVGLAQLHFGKSSTIFK